MSNSLSHDITLATLVTMITYSKKPPGNYELQIVYKSIITCCNTHKKMHTSYQDLN